jgi:hypothetical protein
VRNRMTGALAALLVCSGAGCSSAPTETSDLRLNESPSLEGVITAIGEATVRIEADPADPADGAKAIGRITPASQIVGPDGAAWTIDDLRTGQRVRAWFTGPATKSHPMQIDAARIAVE